MPRMIYVLSCLFIMMSSLQTWATTQPIEENELISSAVEAQPTEYEISILTCGQGSELYASFGHSAIRIKEKNLGIDRVYNYGVFNFNDPKFYQKFTLGVLDYYLDTASFDQFIAEYKRDERKVSEQKLALPQEEIKGIVAFLDHNALPENRSYRYDFTEDNCATRIRDVFPENLGINFLWGDILNNKKATYRHAINLNLTHNAWAKFGINLILGSIIDEPINDDQIMFLPPYLEQGFVHASYRLEPLVSETVILQPKEQELTRKLNGPLWLSIGILILTVLTFHVRAFNYLKPFMRFFLVFTAGLLGFFMLFMWLGTNYEQMSANYNILWAVPVHVVIAFFINKKAAWLKLFSLASISLLMVAFIIHLIGFQILPLIELTPFLLALMYVYIDVYKNSLNPEKQA